MTKTAPASAPAPATAAIAIDARTFRNALGCYGTGVTVVTTRDGAGRNVGLTCNSFASVSLNPALILWSLVVHSPNLSAFQEASHFVVNVLGADQDKLALQFSRSADDKFVGVDWTPGLSGAPVLAGCVATFQCRAADRYYGGDHVIFLGAVEAFEHTAAPPLLFVGGKFGHFAPASPFLVKPAISAATKPTKSAPKSAT